MESMFEGLNKRLAYAAKRSVEWRKRQARKVATDHGHELGQFSHNRHSPYLTARCVVCGEAVLVYETEKERTPLRIMGGRGIFEPCAGPASWAHPGQDTWGRAQEAIA